jgi:hypothetical protein
METIIQLFERLHWWQRPLVAVLPLLLAALVLPALYTSLVRIPLDVLRKQYPQDDQRKGLEHIGYGAGIFAVAGVFRKACMCRPRPVGPRSCKSTWHGFSKMPLSGKDCHQVVLLILEQTPPFKCSRPYFTLAKH